MTTAQRDNSLCGMSDAAPGAAHAVTPPPDPAAGHGWYTAAQIRRAFAPGSRGRKALIRWREHLSEEHARWTAERGEWRFAGVARLPSNGPGAGRTVQEFVQAPSSGRIPEAVKAGTEVQRKRELLNRLIADEYARFCREAMLGPTCAASAKKFRAARALWLAQQFETFGMRVGVGRGALLGKSRRIVRGESTDRRHRSGRHREELFDAEIFKEGVALAIHPNKFSLRGVYGAYAYCAAKAAETGKVWRGNKDTFAERVAEAVPEPFRKLGREGKWKFEAESMPKLSRPRGRFACGEAASLDGRDVDALVRVPASGGGWKAIRPTEIVFFDVESGFPLGWHIAAQESADATLLAIRHMHDRCGLPKRIETDNGKGFCAAFGSRRRNWPKSDVHRVHALCEHLRITVDHRAPKHAWAKSAESRFACMKAIDRLHGHFIGGSPCERPDDVLRRVKKDILELPTLEEWRRLRAADYELYADTPSPALGGLTRRQYFEQHRGEIRKTDPEFLQFASCRLVPEAKLVRRDGVRFRNIVYGRCDEEVWKLQGHHIWLRIDPADLSTVWLCDERGAPLCIATRGDLEGATPEDLREAERRRAHMRKMAREFRDNHAFFDGTAVKQVRHVLAEHRAAEAAERARRQPPPASAPVDVIGSAQVPAVRKAKAAARKEQLRRAVQGMGEPEGERVSNTAQTGLDLLLAAARETREPTAESECLADRLVRFVNAG